jgi:hypothetical protein
MTSRTVLLILLATVIVSAPLSPSSGSQGTTLSGEPADRTVQCCSPGTPRDSVLPDGALGLRETLTLGNTTIRVEPSIPTPPTGWMIDARFDYRIGVSPAGDVYHMTRFGQNADAREDLAYRVLGPTAVSCFGPDRAIVYFGLKINGSMHATRFVGAQIGRATIDPIDLGHSSYGVLAIDTKIRGEFSVWDSTFETETNAMNFHDYRVRRYRWARDGRSVEFLGERHGGVAYPGDIEFHGQRIRLGEPLQK